MCSPKIAQVVRERIAKEGRSTLSRRDLFRVGGTTAAGLAVASFAAPPSRARAQGELETIVDLSHVFSVNMPTYTLGEEPTRTDHVTIAENGYYIQKWEFYEHAGTHVDIPAHFIEGGVTADLYPAEKLIARAVVIDISERAASDADTAVTVEDIETWVSANGDIPENSVVFMYSGWETRWNDVEAFRNADADGVMHFPGFSGEAAAWLAENPNVLGIGVDTLSLDPGNSATFDTHFTILGAEKFGIEGVANLTSIMGNPEAKIVVGLPRWEEGSGGPCRLLALV